MIHTIIGAIIGVIVAFIVALVALPVLSIKFTGMVFLIIVFAVVMIMVGYGIQSKKVVTHLPGKVGGIILVLSIGDLIIGFIASSAMFKAGVKQKMLDVQEVVFDESVPNVDMENLIIWTLFRHICS